jgi:hypothetical protein
MANSRVEWTRGLEGRRQHCGEAYAVPLPISSQGISVRDPPCEPDVLDGVWGARFRRALRVLDYGATIVAWHRPQEPIRIPIAKS